MDLSDEVLDTLVKNYDEGGVVHQLVELFRQGCLDQTSITSNINICFPPFLYFMVGCCPGVLQASAKMIEDTSLDTFHGLD